MRALGATLALLLLLASPAQASLAPEEREELTRALRILADGPAPEARRLVGKLLQRPDQDRAALEEFFRFYFARDPLTPELARSLAGPTLGAKSTSSRANLQEALAAVLVDEIESTFRSLVPRRHERNAVIAGHLGASMQLLGRIAHEGDLLSSASRAEHVARLKRVIAAHPETLRKEVTIDTRARPGLAALRAHLYKNLRDLQDPFDPNGFVAAAGFTGPYADLVRRHGLLVLDNNGFDEAQLRAIQELLALIPPGMHRATHISQHRLLGNKRGRGVELKLRGSQGVNVFRTPVRETRRNQFPPDVAPVEISRFCAALQHELNHVVDAAAVRDDPALFRRRQQLVDQAGVNPTQYLRSGQPRGFFAKRPQEFFASMSNQYFASSSRTLELALARLGAGRREPANQFLFFAEVYSRGGDATLFIEQDRECRYTATRVPVGRDENGRIDRLTWQGTEYRFALDSEGNVKLRGARASLAGRADAAATRAGNAGAVLPEG